jgi:hypothetical protein
MKLARGDRLTKRSTPDPALLSTSSIYVFHILFFSAGPIPGAGPVNSCVRHHQRAGACRAQGDGVSVHAAGREVALWFTLHQVGAAVPITMFLPSERKRTSQCACR